jgi:hypothetical protein
MTKKKGIPGVSNDPSFVSSNQALRQLTSSMSRTLYRVTMGPYKNFLGFKVDPKEVRGRVGWIYLENFDTGDVYEVNPKHVEEYKKDVA